MSIAEPIEAKKKQTKQTQLNKQVTCFVQSTLLRERDLRFAHFSVLLDNTWIPVQ